MLELQVIKRTDPRLLADMAVHYSQPKGFVGRNICYAVMYDGVYYGAIVIGSATKYLPGRNEFLIANNINPTLNEIGNNIFFHVEPHPEYGYPTRNFVGKVLKLFRQKAKLDWKEKYKNELLVFETLVELPRTGSCYTRDKWVCTGQTKGFTCKRVAGKGTDSWSGKRVWNTTQLRPKLVFMKLAG